MDADFLEAIRKSQVANALPDDEETDPDWLYGGDQGTAEEDTTTYPTITDQPRFNPNAQSLADYSRPAQSLEPEYAGVAEDQAPKVVQPPAVPSPLPEVLQPEYAGISPDQEGGAAPDIVPQVERGQLVSTPLVPSVAAASAEVTPGVVPPVTEPAPDTLTQVERATPVSLSPPQPVAQASRELALRAQLMKLPPVQPVAQATRELGIAPRAQPVAGPAPDTLAQVERGQSVDTDSDQAQLELASLYEQGVRGTNVPQGTIAQPSAQEPQARTRLNPNDQSLDDYSKPVVAPPTPTTPAAQQPAVPQGGETGVADFYRKRGDKPITSGNDPRLTTVNVGGQNWRVNKEAAPYFQGFLNELAAKGAPTKALYPNAGWAYRKIAGTDTVSEHAYGGAIDVNQTLTGRNQVTAEFQKWMAANPGALEAAEKKWNIYGGERFGDLGHFEWGGVPFKQKPAERPHISDKQAAQQPEAQPSQLVTTNPDGSDFPQRVQAVGNNDPAAFITHHTSGRGTVDGVISTLKQRGLGVQYVMDRDGNIFATGGPGAQNILTGWGPKGTGLSNQNIVGMEIIAKDDKDVTPAQAQSFARFMAARYPNTPIFGHGEVNPGHKEEDEGQTAKAAALAYRAQGGREQGDQAARAEPATKGQNGLYPNEKPEEFLTGPATTFATPDDIASGRDNGVGSPRLGKLDTTQVAGVAIPEEALRAQYGNNYAAWRRARVDVVDTTTGRRLRLPVVDLVGTDVAVDMTPFVSSYFGGDKTLSVKLVPNAGPDATKNPQLFADEQAAIKQGIDSSSLQAGVQKIQGKLNYQLTSPDPAAHAKIMAADAAQQAQQRQVIAALPEVTSGNVMGAYNRLNNPIPGVSDAMRLDAQKNLKAQAIAAMQAKFPELRTSDSAAWAQAQSPAGIAEFGRELGRQIFANYGKLDVAFNQMMQGADSNRMTQFAKILHPDYNAEGLAAFTKSLTDIQDPAVRSQTIGKLWAGLDPQIQSSFDVNGLVTAADNLSSPAYQQAQNEAIETKRQYLDKVAAPDPRLKGTTAEWWAQTIGAIPANVSMAFLPPGAMETAFAAQIYADTKDKVKAAHPDWSEAQVAEMTRNSTIAQLLPQEVLSAISAGTLGPLVERLSGGKLKLNALTRGIESIDNPALRAVTMAGTHVAAGAGVGTAQQIAANVAEGRPALEGVLQAAAGGAVIGAPGALIHGLGALRRSEEAAVPEARPTEPLPAREEPARLQPEPPPLEEKPPVEEEPAGEPVDEEALNQQSKDLYDQNKREGEIVKELPIEEKPVPVDIVKGEPEPERAGELGGVAGEIGRIERPGEVRRDSEQELLDVGRPAQGGGENVPQELRRVQRPLEASLPPVERASLQPFVDALARHPQGTDPSKAAYQKLFEAIYTRWKPIFEAGGIKRVDNPGDFDGIAGARHDYQGNLELLLGHGKFEEAAHIIMDRGNDPAEYINHVLQEELIHHAEQLVLRDRWNTDKAKGKFQGNFNDYRFQKSRELLDNWLKAADQARAKGNHDLADEIEGGLHKSIQLYGRFRMPELAQEHFKGVVKLADEGHFESQAKLSNIASEFARQMLQSKHGDMIEPFWKQAMGRTIQWFQDIITGLKGLYAKLGVGQPLAKTKLAGLIRAMERKVATLERRAGKATEKAGPETTAGERFGPETPRAPRKNLRETLGEAVARMRMAHSLGFKGGESAMLDYVPALARAIRKHSFLVQDYGQRARLAQLVNAFESVPRSERARVVKEWTNYTRAEQLGQALPAVGADTMRLINARKDTAQGLGSLIKELNVHVKDSGGRIRPVRLIGDNYYPRNISADMHDIFNNRDGSRAGDFDKVVNQSIATGEVKNRQEFIERFTHAINGEAYSNDQMSNLERARELRLPMSMYDFSPETFIRYADRAVKRLAQIGSFGQKLSDKGKDVFDHGIEDVNARSGLSYDQKKAIVDRILKERDAQFRQAPADFFGRVSSLGRTAASGAFLSNPQTSWMNLISGAAQNMVFGGPLSFAKAAASFPFKYRGLVKEARDRNILRANLRNILDDYDLVTNPNWVERGVRQATGFGLKWGGQELTESINRVFGMQQAKEILREFTRDYGVKDNPMARERTQFVKRRFGFKHDEDASRTLTALAREGGTGKLSDEFINQFVQDVHGNYGPGQAASHIFDSPAGKVLTQFQKWGANTSRMLTREYLMPLARSLKSGDPAEIGYHVLRTVGYAATGAGVTSLGQGILNWMYQRDPKDPTYNEIGKVFQKGDYGNALGWSLQKLYGLIQLSGFTGLFGNTYDAIQNKLGFDPSGRLKDPFNPPAWGVMQPFISLWSGIRGEGYGIGSPKVWDDFARQLLSPYRVGKQTVLGGGAALASSAGIKIPWSEEYAANNTRNFARDRIRMYEAQNPVLQQKAEAKGTQQTSIAMAGRSPFSPTRDRIINGLLSGHSEDVNSAIRDWLTRVPLENRKAEYKRIKSVISSHNPMMVGGSSEPEAIMQFLDWAKTNLPEGEARRIYSLASTYAKTAIETGMEEKSKPMHALASLDYDKFKVPKAVSPAAAAAAKAKAEAQGRQTMEALVRRQGVANQLLGH